jgi:hypothetical protein
MRQRKWGMWVSEITDQNTGHRIWLGTFQSVAQAAWRHDIENVRLYGGDCGEIKSPLVTDEPTPELVTPPARGAQLTREDREAWERLEADHASEEYMANLRRNNPERAADETVEFARYEDFAPQWRRRRRQRPRLLRLRRLGGDDNDISC